MDNTTYFEKYKQNRTSYNHTHIVNLSSHSLSKSESSILSKGLNFVPTPSSPSDTSLFKESMKSYARSLRLIFFFRNSTNTLGYKHPYKPPSSWIPPKASLEIEEYIKNTNSNPPICKLKIPLNISHQERKAIRDLKTNKKLIIKKADKGSSIVLQDKTTYLKEGLEHLNDQETYTQLGGDPTEHVAEKIDNFIEEIYSKGYIDEYTKNFLKTPHPCRTHRIYFLKKIHKNPHGIRPIVSCVSGPTAHISAFLDNLIKPLAMQTNSYIKNSSHILQLLSDLHLPPQVLLVTIDVKSLYTCIPQEEGTDACIEAIEKAHITDIPSTVLRTLFQLVLRCNIMRFNDKIFTQITGTAMGTIMAPNYAILFMDRLETTFLQTQVVKPLVWRRYIDDILCIWTGTREQLTCFLDNLNRFHNHIKFTHEISDTEVTFLDLQIYKGSEFLNSHILSTKTHFKQTNTFQYLHYNSSHPRNTFKGIIKGEAIRFLRANTEEKNFNNHIKDLIRHFSYRGYPKTFILKSLEGITYDKRYLYLKASSPPKIIPTQMKNNIPRFIITFSPYMNTLKECLLKYWPTDVSSFMQKPQISFKKNPSISNKLVRAQISSDPPSQMSTYNLPVTIGSTSPLTCQDKECYTCKKITQKKFINDTTQSKTYSTKNYPICCHHRNVVYTLKCNTCSILFVGRTKSGQTLKARHREHLQGSREIKHKSWPIYKHFKSHKTTFGNNHSIIPLQIIPHFQHLSKLEKVWIMKLKTIHPHGLNLTIPS